MSPHAKVVVLEAEEQIGFHSSGRSAALLHYALGNPPVRRLTQASRPFFEGPPDGSGDLSSRLPILTPAREDELAGLQALADDLSPFTAIEWLDEAGLRRECPVLRVGPGEAVRGFIDRTALKLDGHALLQGFSHQLRSNGGGVVADARVVAIARAGNAWRVETERGAGFEAPLVVNAGGAWADGVARMAGVIPVGLQPMRRTMFGKGSLRSDSERRASRWKSRDP